MVALFHHLLEVSSCWVCDVLSLPLDRTTGAVVDAPRHRLENLKDLLKFSKSPVYPTRVVEGTEGLVGVQLGKIGEALAVKPEIYETELVWQCEKSQCEPRDLTLRRHDSVNQH